MKQYDIPALVLMTATLVFILVSGLLPVLLAGLIVHVLVFTVSARITYRSIRGQIAKMVTVAFLAIVIVFLISFGFISIYAFFQSDQGNLTVLINHLAEILDSSRDLLPVFMVERLPSDATALKETVVQWLHIHAADLQSAGKDIGLFAAHILIGMILGALISLHEAGAIHSSKPLLQAISERVRRFSESFHDVVFAQIKIASINTIMTWLYLGVALPFFDIHLPFLKTMVLLTFIFGLLPVIGNIVTNCIIVIISLSISLELALISLAYLVIIHKLEYFLNARIVGSQIKAHIWEILLAMVVMETIFGLSGLIVAPIFYAYMKNELQRYGLI